MIAAFKYEEQKIELGGGEFERFVKLLETEKRIAILNHTETETEGVSEVIEASTGERAWIKFNYHQGVLICEAECKDTFMRLLKAVTNHAISGLEDLRWELAPTGTAG